MIKVKFKNGQTVWNSYGQTGEYIAELPNGSHLVSWNVRIDGGDDWYEDQTEPMVSAKVFSFTTG